jgi:hypothetical protein
MSKQLDLSNLTTKQLTNLLWQVKGTPQAQPIYAELHRRPSRFTLEPDDPDWEKKMRAKLAQSSTNQ